MRKHNLFKVVMIVILLLVLTSWFLPSGTLETPTGDTFNRVGLFQLFMYFLTSIVNFVPVAFFILTVGGLYGVLNKIPAYRKLLDSIVSSFKGLELLFMAIVMVVFAVLTSMVGFAYPLLILFPFVISVILLMGYNKVTAALVTVGSVSVGIIGTVFSSTNVETIAEYTQIPANTYVWHKLILLVIAFAIVFLNVYLYSRKHRDTKNLVEGVLVPEKVKKTNSYWPLVVVLDLVLIVLGLGFFSWKLFNVDLFENMTTAFVAPTGNVKSVFTVLNSIIGISEGQAFGTWSFVEASVVVLLGTGLISFIYRKKLDEFLDNFKDGFKFALKPALLTVLIYTVVVVVSRVQNEYSFTQFFVSASDHLNIFTMIPFAILFVVLGVELLYGGALGGPYIVAVIGAGTVATAAVVALLWQAIGGFVLLFAPTSVILMVTLSYLNVSYKKWIKAIWPIILELLAAITVVIFIFQNWIIK